MTPIMSKRIEFESFDIVYPAVPQQDNRYFFFYPFYVSILYMFLLFIIYFFIYFGFTSSCFWLFRDDCGVFSVMYMKHWTPRTPIRNLFGSADIDNIRIKLANELYFSPNNSADKSFVTNFFGGVSLFLNC